MQNVWLLLCFFVSCHFFGPAYNPIFVLPALLGPLLVLLTTPTARLSQFFETAPLFGWGCIASIGLVMLHHSWVSMSPDTSYIPSLVLVCLPLWAFALCLLDAPKRFWLMLSVLIAVFAALSVFEFITSQQRAHAPLRDPGNYTTLLYLIWVPWVFKALRRTQQVEKPMLRSEQLWLFGLSFVFVLAQLATHSRFAVLVVLGVVVVMIAVAVRHKTSWKVPAIVAAAVLCAAIFYLVLDQSAVTSSFSASAADSQGNTRLLLWQSAISGISEFGGRHGSGVYSYSLIYPLVRSPLEQATIGVLVHNDFLQLFLEGGIWLAIPFLWLLASIGFGLLKALFSRQLPNNKAWFLLALSIALLHASVNFLFYILPLTLLFGVLLAMAYMPAREIVSADKPVNKYVFAGKFVAVGLLLANVVYLSFDVFTLGVFAGQNHVPGASYVRENPARKLSYARLAQTVNARRSLPVLAEARMLDERHLRTPTPLLASQTELAYERALEVNAWQPVALLDYANFGSRINNEPDYDQRKEELMRRAWSLNPTFPYANASLLQWYASRGEFPKARTIAENVAQWCIVISRNPAGAELFGHSMQLAKHIGADELTKKLRGCQELPQTSSGGGRKQTWIMRWLSAPAS